MVGVSASVNLPLHHKVQWFSSGTGSPGWSRKKGRKRLWWTLVEARDLICILQCLYTGWHRLTVKLLLILLLANVNVSERDVRYEYMLSPVRLSVVCLSSVTLVHPTQAVEIFGSISTTLGTLAIRWHPQNILRKSSQATPPSGELNIRG